MRHFPTRQRFLTLTRCLLILLLSATFASAQGAANPENTADKNLKSAARVNPSTLAMEFTMPFGAYPGRNGNSIPVSFSYSSKLWRMTQFSTRTSGAANYSYHNPIFGDKTAAGWSSSVQAPRLKSGLAIYDPSGSRYMPHMQSMMVFPQQPFEYNAYTATTPTICAVTSVQIEDEPPSLSTVECSNTEIMRNYSMGATYQQNFEQDKRFVVKRFYMTMPNGSSVEFRKDDNIYELCDSQNPAPAGCLANLNATTAGTYLSTDGSRMRLEIGETQPGDQLKHVLYLPNGSRYIFPAANTAALAAEQFIDADGNRLSYQAETATNTLTVTDTMGRQIEDPLPGNWFTQAQTVGTKTVSIKGINNDPLNYQIIWAQLKTPGCADSTTPGCGASVLEDDAQALKYRGASGCEEGTPTVLSDSLFANDPDVSTSLVCAKLSGTAARFNPVVLSEITQPDGTKYKFRYNIYGEITRIDYPTGGYERFAYEAIPALGFDHNPIFEQTNRGVRHRWVSIDGTNLDQHWEYEAIGSTNYVTAPYFVKTTAPDGSRTERYLNDSSSTEFGFANILSGMPYDERSYDTAGHLRSRTLTDWTVKSTPVLWTAAQRDPRVKRRASIIIEGDKALATFSTTDYDENGSTDPAYFSHLNATDAKSYHYAVISKSAAENPGLSWTTIENLFAGAVPAAHTQTDYLYGGTGTTGDVYKQRGMIGLPTETRSLNPANPAEVLAKSQLKYDEAAYPTLDPTLSTIGWSDPLTLRECVSNAANCKRGKVTGSRTWVRETDTWLETHAQYDNFGNLRKAWDVSGDPTKVVETQYSSTHHYAYPTKVITPAPNVGSDDFGTTQTSWVETTYDQATGLPLSVKNDAEQTTKTEYDALSRPWRTYAFDYTAPETQTIYSAPDPVTGQFAASQRFSRVRKQIDASNWAEATTWFDGLGRTIKTQSKDAQGDVFTETQYDVMGRVVMTTNPYRTGDTKLWNLTEFDAAGRAYRSRAPVAVQNPASPTGDILGTSAFDISTVSGFVGTVGISTDASGRKSRSITNALGQLLRVDEATATGGAVNTDLGTLAAPTQPTFYKYDVYGKMVRVQQGKTGETIQNRYFLYDSLGRLLRVRQPEQEINSALNTTGNPDNNSWTAGFTYDIFGNVLTAIDSRNVTITNTYDRANRLLTKTYSGETTGQTPTVYFTYDGRYYGPTGFPLTATGLAKGSLTQVRNGISTSQTIEYDTLGRAKKYQQVTDSQTYTSEYAYNFAGALIEEKYPSGRTVKNEFDADGDLLRIAGKVNAAAIEKTYANGFSYTADGRIAKLHLGNGLWEAAKFNSRLQITELGLGVGAENLDKWKVNYDYGELNTDGVTFNATKNTGNIAKQTVSFAGLTNPFVQTYRYDSLNRLKEATEKSGAAQTWQQTFDYDRFGNRTGFYQKTGNVELALNNQTHPQIDPLTNRFLTSEGYDYDKNGNIITDATSGANRAFIFNGDNKQTEVKDASNQIVGKYFYDGEGKRIKKQTATQTTIFVYSGGKIIEEYSTEPLSATPTTNYVATDILQSVRAISDANGQVTSRRDFMPFGEELFPDTVHRTVNQKYSSQTDQVRQKFTGYQKDEETNLDFAEARMYQNSHGRFTAVDPLLASGKSANPQTFNRYVYCLNNPLIFTDPNGMQAGSSTGYWTFRDNLSTDGQTQSRQFYHFGSELEQETLQGAWGGNTFQKWSGGNFYVYGDNKAVHLGESGNGLLFSTSRIAGETLNGIINTQESGGTFDAHQNNILSMAASDAFQQTPQYQQAMTEASIIGPGAAAGVERAAATGLSRLANNISPPNYKFNIFGEGEAKGYIDVSTNSVNAYGRPLTNSFPSGSAERIFIRDAPITGENTVSEIIRLSRPGTRITFMSPSQSQMSFFQNALKNHAVVQNQRTWTRMFQSPGVESTITTFKIK